MDGKTHTYLDLAAIKAVGDVLLDPRPAFVFSGEGSGILWANAAGAAFFGEQCIADLLGRRLSGLNPVRAQIGRLTRLLPADRSRLEILRIGFGVSLATLAAACRRLNLGDGSSAVLAIGAGGVATESLGARAEHLAVALAGKDRLAAVLDDDRRMLGTSAGFDDLAPAAEEIDALLRAADRSDTGQARTEIAIGTEVRPAGAVRFDAGGRTCTLLIVEPARAGAGTSRSETSPVAEPAAPGIPPTPNLDATGVPPTPNRDATGVPPTPNRGATVAATEPVVRFVWRTDPDHRFTLISSELAEIVGDGNAAIAGRSWDAIARILDLDADGAVGAAFDRGKSWAATVYWPIAGAGERIAVDLLAEPAIARAGQRTGFSGFGVCRRDDRRRDERREALSLNDAVMTDEPASASAPGATAETAPATVEEEEAPGRPSQTRGEDDLDDAARKSVEEGVPVDARATPAAKPTAPWRPAIAEAPSNIVHLPGAPPPRMPPEQLTGTEEDAFRRIAEALASERSEGARTAPASPSRREERERGPAGKAPSAAIDGRLLDRVPIGLAIFRENKPLFANRILLDLLDYDSFDQFASAGGVEAIFPDRAGGWAGDSLGDAGAILTARRRDGGIVPVEVRLHAVAWAGATALMFSISPRHGPSEESERAAAAKLAAAEARLGELEEILDTATDGVIVIDRTGRIGRMNRAAEALFAVDADTFRGRHFTDLLAAESHKAALDYLDGLAANGVASVLNDGREVIGSVPQGGLIPLFMTMGRIGGSDAFCAVLRDITHWKRVEEELTTARHAAETANAQKSEFLAKVSHEIRTPLNAIIGFSEVMMEERFGPIGNERYRAYLRDIHVSGAHLMSLINDLLDLSKIEAGKLELSFEAVPVNTLIQESVALMQPLANRERIIIRTSLSAEVPNVVADLRSFRQILLNLLSNAIKFTKAGGQVIVSSALEDSGEVLVRIRDTGVGMSEKDMETALKPFHQVAAAREARDKGTGLGLPLTKALVEANRANLAIDSAIDQGTLVRITFPTTRVLAG